MEQFNNLESEYKAMLTEYQMAKRKALASIENVADLLKDDVVIEGIESREKDFKSVEEKCRRKNYEKTDASLPPYYDIDTIRKYVQDIEGIRVITLYRSDVYRIYETIKRTDLVIFHTDDYIKTPKDSGYRSLHLIVMVQVPTNDGTKLIPVEIQLRSKAMDLWASHDHKFRYKNDNPDAEAIELLQNLAIMIEEADKKAERIRTKKPAE